MLKQGFLVLENGESFAGVWLVGAESAGEVVFNTSHNGYEEIATDPSYFGQIMVMCAPQQGNYGVDSSFWESRALWIKGFIALDIQNSPENSDWLNRLRDNEIPAMDSLNTRQLVLTLRQRGTQVGAMVQAQSSEEAHKRAASLISAFKDQPQDWAHQVSRKQVETVQGAKSTGPRVAILDFGCKQNILRELIKRCREINIYPARTPADEILQWKPAGVLLSNGPGDPERVEVAVATIQQLLGQTTLFGICMGHQLLARALGGRTFRLKFGHRGANHPIKNMQTGQVYMTSQNHGYAVQAEGLPSEVAVTHMNLNDQTVSGIACRSKRCFSVQYHPESHPGPRDAETLFDQFIDWIET
jgi:carbamoyl-phosphate synthase small subunit